MHEKAANSRRVVIPGGSGHVGTLMAKHFHARGDEVVVLSRRAVPAPWRVVRWDGVNPGSWIHELDGCDVLINLVGRSVNCRYNPPNRSEILQSRVQSTNLLSDAVARVDRPPRLWMNASTATIYRHALDRPMDEFTGEIGGQEPDVPDTWRFSIEVATAWEAAFFAAYNANIRKVALRSAITLSPEHGSIFDILLRLVRFGLGGKSGSGEQFVSWIHHTDFLRAMDYIVEHEELAGPINVASPSPLPNKEFMHHLREAWGTKIGLPATEWMLGLGAIFLRTETELVLKSRRVVPGKLLQNGFRFELPNWRDAAGDLVQHWRRMNQARAEDAVHAVAAREVSSIR